MIVLNRNSKYRGNKQYITARSAVFLSLHHQTKTVLSALSQQNWKIGCRTAEEHVLHNQEVVGLNPVSCWAGIISLSF